MRHPFSGEAFRRDRYAVYRELRSESPVLLLEREGGHEAVVTRHDDVETVLRDDRFSVNRLLAPEFREAAEDLPDDLRPEEQNPSLLNLDPPDHTRLRKLISKAFTPRRVEELAPRIERRADELLDAIDAREPFDLVSRFAAPLPARVIADLLGVPESDHPLFRDWSDRLLQTLVGSRPDLDGFRDAREELEAYLATVVEQRRRAPEDDLVSALVEAREEDSALEAGELLGTCTLLLVAGHETTANLVANATWMLLDGSASRAAFEKEPEPAVEEFLRFESPIQAIGRVAREDLDLGGTRVPAGTMVTAVLGAANRDPEVFDDPERLDLAREDNPHLAFGNGVHFCLGGSLARLEARIALTRLLERFPGLERVEPEPAWRPSGLLRGHEQLRVRSNELPGQRVASSPPS